MDWNMRIHMIKFRSLERLMNERGEELPEAVDPSDMPTTGKIMS